MRVLAFARPRVVVLSLVFLTLLGAGTAWTGHQADYDLDWWTVDTGGQTFSTGDGYTLGGTAGQPDANVLHGGEYALSGGFWPGGETVSEPHDVYLPLVLR